MSRSISLLVMTAGLLIGQYAFAQQPHPFTWDERIRSVDDTVTIYGETHTIARLPAIELGTGTRYAVFFPWPGRNRGFQSVSIVARHQESLQSFEPNSEVMLTINGFPALLTVYEQLSLNLTPNGSGGEVFRPNRSIFVYLYIDIGDTVLSLATDFSEILPSTDIGTSSNAVSSAQWRRYADDPAVIAAIDKWIDFVRVKAL